MSQPSWIWPHFTSRSSGEQREAVCKYCSTVYKIGTGMLPNWMATPQKRLWCDTEPLYHCHWHPKPSTKIKNSCTSTLIRHFRKNHEGVGVHVTEGSAIDLDQILTQQSDEKFDPTMASAVSLLQNDSVKEFFGDPLSLEEPSTDGPSVSSEHVKDGQSSEPGPIRRKPTLGRKRPPMLVQRKAPEMVTVIKEENDFKNISIADGPSVSGLPREEKLFVDSPRFAEERAELMAERTRLRAKAKAEFQGWPSERKEAESGGEATTINRLSNSHTATEPSCSSENRHFYPQMAFEGKVVIVTGSSSGIGAATALRFVNEGASVTITGRNESRLEAVREALTSAGTSTDRILTVVGDVTNKDVQRQIVEGTVNRFGRLDVLVNNAGAGVPDGGKVGTEASLDNFNSTISINLTSVLELIKLAKPHIIKTKGAIVNVSSICGQNFGYATSMYYSIAKAGLDQLTRASAIELIAHGVRVNSVSPGFIATSFLTNIGVPDQGAQNMYEYAASNPDMIPAQRIGEPDDIATVILFLADRSKSGFIVGQTIIADGGSTLKMALDSPKLAEQMFAGAK